MNDLDRFRIVLFDFDGTIADSFSAIALSVNHVRARHGLPPLTLEGVKIHVGRGPGYLLSKTVPGYEPDIDNSLYRAHHLTVMNEHTTLLPGTLATLQALSTLGKGMGLCSNKPRFYSRDLLEHLEILSFFTHILGPEDVVLPKPAPDMLITALQRFEVGPEQALYVGDMTVDIETARGAGVTVWIVPTGSETRAVLEKARPDRLLENLHELATMAMGKF